MSTILQVKRVPNSVFKSATVDQEGKENDLNYDLGNLAAFDTHALNTEELKKNKEEYLQSVSRDNIQLLFNKLFQLPTEVTEVGPVANLPECTSQIPREKPIPVIKETKWDKFAREKGIKQRKHNRMEFDEQTKEWKPIWGYGKAKKGMQDDKWVSED
ncbi:hypothetical protein WA158_001771 [Blastocystis sp. Blastoise]